MTDEDRLIEAVAYAWYRGKRPTDRAHARSLVETLQGAGITLTPPPAPEPTFSIRGVTLYELNVLRYAIRTCMYTTAEDSAVAGTLLSKALTPDEDTE